MSLDGTTNTFIPYTINGINPVAGSINTTNFVKYNGNTDNTNLGEFDLTTTGTISAQNFAIPDNNSNNESWISYTVSTMGNPSTVGGLITTNITSGQSMYYTGAVLGAPNFQFATLGGNAGKVICTNANSVFSTTINAGQLDYITALTSQAGGVGQQNTWTNIQFHSADVSTTGSARFIQPYNATTLNVSTLVNRATLDSAISVIPNLLTLSNTWSGAYNQFNGTVSTMGSNRFIQPYNALSADISTLVNRATLDSAIAGLGAGILTLNNTWSGTNTFNNTLTTSAEYTTSLNGTLRTIQTATQFNPTLDANSYFITGVSPTTYVFSTNWIVNPVSGTTANIALDPAVFYFSTSVKYIISFTGIFGTGATWVGTVVNNSTSLTVSDASIAITTTSQNLTMTFTAGSSNPTIYLRFVGASGTLRWTNFTIKEVDAEILGNLTLSSQIDSNITQSNGRTANLAGGLKVNQTSIATATSLTTASLPTGVSASSLSGAYTLTATAGGTTFGMWLGSGFTYTAGAKYNFTFTGFSTNATATQAMILYTNTYTAGSGTFIGDYIVNVPITSSTISGSFTATSNNNVVWNFIGSASGRSISFTGFTLTRADTEIPGNIYAPRITTTTSIALTTAGGTLTMASNGRTTHASGDNSYTLYGPNSSWGRSLAVGSTPDVANATTAQVIGNNGDLFLDGANSKGIYYGSYASSRGTPNFHTFYGNVQLAGNEVIEGGYSFKKIGGNVGQNYFLVTGDDTSYSPYITFYQNNLRRMYVGFATATEAQIATENGAQLAFMTGGSTRMTIDTAGITTISSNELRVSNPASAAGGQIRLTSGSSGYGTMLYNDSTDFYILLSNSGSPNGGYNGLRPLKITQASGLVQMDNGLTIGGTTAVNINTNGGLTVNGSGGSAGIIVNGPAGINCVSGGVTSGSQPFCIVGGVGGASISYGAGGANFGSSSQLLAYTSAGMSNISGSGWDAPGGNFWFTRAGKWQINWSFYWNNFGGGSRAQLRHFDRFGTLLETRYCALNGAGIGADSTQAYSSVFFVASGSYFNCNFQSGSGALYFGGITHTHLTCYFLG